MIIKKQAVRKTGSGSDSQTASGQVNVTSTSPDLYICEPVVNFQGFACGSDDSGADETVFETLEDLGRGEHITWDIKLQNIGTTSLTVTDVVLNVTEVSDPGSDCPDASLSAGYNIYAIGSPKNANRGAFILRDGNPSNDFASDNEIADFSNWGDGDEAQRHSVFIEPTGYEDLRLSLRLLQQNTQNCDGNVWNVSWQFDVG